MMGMTAEVKGGNMRWRRCVRPRVFMPVVMVTGVILLFLHLHTMPNTLRQVTLQSRDDLAGPAHRDDVIGQGQDEVNASAYLQCVDPEGKGEVQDLFCMKRPHYLSHYKNPCWVDWTTELQRLRCLPYFHVLGADKCGTTDLHSRIAQHPHILLNGGGLGKETYYWCWTKYGQWMKKAVRPKPFGKYLLAFDKPLATIVENTDLTGFHPLITGDGTPMDFWDFRAWPLIPQNHGLKEPVVLTPHLMKHLYRDPKFIIILRNPVDRLYSDYIFLGYGWTPEKFRIDVPRAVDMMERCMQVNTTRQCVFSNHTYVHLPMRIHIGMYSVFMKEWLAVFPRSAFYILRTEDYHANMTHHLTAIYDFLGVESLPDHMIQDIVGADRKHETKAKKKVADMYPDTRATLQNFYDRYNQDLAVMLDDPRFLWMDSKPH
ncbi:carbohydrate sulfotransferase 15-like isoform X2 [Babylonia areolata]|uniref:carbohydrate sulfotransferase 15-like isoform X2 n=1 Tax=Babylonia areolata TaxID=304850 RepID=UPI003FD08C44